MDSLQAFIDLTDDNFDSIIGSVNVAATDNMNGYYVWEANGQPAPNAPTTQVFLVSPMQQIYDYSPSGSSEVSSIADSFGSVCVDTNSGTGNTQVPSTDHSYLVNLPVLNGIATINDLATFGMTLSSSGSTTNPWASAYSDVRETMYAQPDTRTVTLHRTGATGETTDLDSTVHGDTIYSTTNYN